MRRVALALGLVGCGAPPSAPPADVDAAAPSTPVTMVAGEVHLHEFPEGGHAWADFIEAPVPITTLRGDSLFELDTAVTRVEGPCALYVQPTCAPDCSTGTYCYADASCAPVPSRTYVDASAIDVFGSKTLAKIHLASTGTMATYASDPPPGAAKLFAGGETLVIEGGSGDYAFHGELPAPLPVAVTAPDMKADLHLPFQGPLVLGWKSENTDEIEVLVSASASDGRSAVIRCVTPDTGALTLSAALMAGLPPPPRVTRLEILRIEQRVIAMKRPGVGVLMHAAQSTWENGRD